MGNGAILLGFDHAGDGAVRVVEVAVAVVGTIGSMAHGECYTCRFARETTGGDSRRAGRTSG